MNKKIVLALLSATLLIGCGDKEIENKNIVETDQEVISISDEEVEVKPVEEEKEEVKSSVMNNFLSVLKEKPQPVELYKFIENNIDSMENEDLNKVVKYYIAYLDQYKIKYDSEIYNEKVMSAIYEELKYNVTNESIETLQDGEIKGLLSEIYKQGYEITVDGEYPSANVDFEKLMTFKDHMSNGMFLYLKNGHNYYDDVQKFNLTRKLDFDKYTDEILEFEKYLKENSVQDEWYFMNYSMYKKRIALVFVGTEFNNIYDPVTNKLKDDYNSYFNQVIANHLDTDFGKLTKSIYDKIVLENFDPYYGAYNDINEYKIAGLNSTVVLNSINDFASNYQITYKEITLDDKNIEDRINKSILKTIEDGKEKLGWESDDSKYLTVNNKIGYLKGNIISYEFFFTVSNEDYSEYESITYGKTFDLSTGKEIPIEDLFKRSIVTIGDRFNEKIAEKMNYLDSEKLSDYDVKLSKKQAYYLNDKEIVVLFYGKSNKSSEVISGNYSFEELLLDYGIDLR
jgi:hypothetical protein